MQSLGKPLRPILRRCTLYVSPVHLQNMGYSSTYEVSAWKTLHFIVLLYPRRFKRLDNGIETVNSSTDQPTNTPSKTSKTHKNNPQPHHFLYT